MSLVYCLIGVSEFSYLFIVIDINFGTAFSNDLSFAQTWKLLVVFLIFWMNKPTWEETNILQIASWWEVCSYSFTWSDKFHLWNWSINNIDKNSTWCILWNDGIACCFSSFSRICRKINGQTHFAGCFLQKIKTWKNFNFFYQNHGLTPKSRFFDL